MTHVYVIQAEGGPVKVGVAADPARRLVTLRTGTPFRLSLAHVQPIEADLRAVAVERATHALLSAAHAHGEWFAVSAQEAKAAIHEAIRRLRTPAPSSAAETPAGAAEVVTGEQLRGARAMARIEQAELARQAGVSVDTIKRLERTVGPISANVNTMAAIVTVLEAAGVEFTNGGQPGVRLAKKSS